MQFFTLLVFSADLNIHCSRLFSHHFKFYSFVFMHRISTQVVCVSGKHHRFPYDINAVQCIMVNECAKQEIASHEQKTSRTVASGTGGGGVKGAAAPPPPGPVVPDTSSLWMDLFSLDVLIIATCNCLPFSYARSIFRRHIS